MLRNERRPESAYSLSKLVGETLAEQYTRWDPTLKIISLRFSNVMLKEEYAGFEEWQKDPKLRYWNCWGRFTEPLIIPTSLIPSCAPGLNRMLTSPPSLASDLLIL